MGLKCSSKYLSTLTVPLHGIKRANIDQLVLRYSLPRVQYSLRADNWLDVDVDICKFFSCNSMDEQNL